MIGKRASARQIGMLKKKAREKIQTEVEEDEDEEEDEDKIDLDDVPLFSRDDMFSDVEEQDLEDEVAPKKRRGRKPKKAQPPPQSPSVTSMLFISFNSLHIMYCFNYLYHVMATVMS